MDVTYAVAGWYTPQIEVSRYDGGIAPPNALYFRLSGKGERPSPPPIRSRAEVYRWLAGLEEQGFVTTFADKP